MKYIKKIILVFVLLIAYIYALAISAIPENIILFQNEDLNISTIYGLNISTNNNKRASILTSSTADLKETGRYNLNISLFNVLKVKDITVDVVENISVVPVGKLAGLKLYTNGIMVVGMTEITGQDGQKYKPHENTDIQEGDVILEVNGNSLSSSDDLMKCINECNGNEMTILCARDNETFEVKITPVKTSTGSYKIGLWVRDSAAGVGTVTFYNPDSGLFGALGHGIVDIDTEKLIDIQSGEFVTTKIINVIKGTSGEPGKIQGTVDNQKTIGEIYSNTIFGVYGKLTDTEALDIDETDLIPVASRNDIETGAAKILCCVENGEVREYDIEIKKLYLNNSSNNKSMLIEVTDEELLQKTGGIIQGMSGCPIIQNGKFIGAITNVLVSDPTTGYAVFADMMIKELNMIN